MVPCAIGPCCLSLLVSFKGRIASWELPSPLEPLSLSVRFFLAQSGTVGLPGSLLFIVAASILSGGSLLRGRHKEYLWSSRCLI